MAIPTPTIPSSVTSVSAVRLNPTQNNAAFYINSGLIAVSNTETTVISVNDIGKRDILFCVHPVLTAATADDMTFILKNNGNIIYQSIVDSQYQGYHSQPLKFIIPANTSIEITFKNEDSSTHNCGVSAYGYYMGSIQ